MIWSSLQLTSKQWIITQHFTAGADLFLKSTDSWWIKPDAVWITKTPRPSADQKNITDELANLKICQSLLKIGQLSTVSQQIYPRICR